MTALQEAAMRKALEALETCSYGDYSAKHVVDPSFDGDAVEAAIESLKAALAQQGEPNQRLVNLLCRIHRDGGHYIGEHGIDKAVSDADMKVANLNALSDAAAPAPQTEEPVATDNMNHPLRTWKDPLSAWWHCRSNWGIGGIGLSEAEAITNWADENPKEVTRLGLFTRTMPVQPIIGLQDVHDAVTADPTLVDCAQEVNAELVEALEKLARLGNGDQYGNSDGNMIARNALSSYKGAK